MDFEDIKWWFEDNWKTVVGILAVLSVVGLGVWVFYTEADRSGNLPDSYEEQIVTLQEGTERNKETFSLLGMVDTSSFEGQAVYVIDLYNKKPFINSGDLESALRTYIETLKIIESTYDREVRAVQFNIYDRKIKFDNGADPDGVYYYAVPYNLIPESEKVDEDSRYYNMSAEDKAFSYTSLYAPEKLDDSEHRVFGRFNQLQRVVGVEPLSDQEYNWYTKLDTYLALGSSMGSLYLEWELGAPKNSTAARTFSQDVNKFLQRLTAVGEEASQYDSGEIGLRGIKGKLVIENPSFLYYAMTGKIEENAITARSLLVEEYPQEFEQIVHTWVQSLAQEQVEMMNRGQDPATSQPEGEYNDLLEGSGNTPSSVEGLEDETTEESTIEGTEEVEPEEESTIEGTEEVEPEEETDVTF